jgi:hypothetical protein
MVGATGIEPVTPTMSTQRVDGNCGDNRAGSAENFPIRSRSDHGNLGRFLGGSQSPETRRAVLPADPDHNDLISKADKNEVALRLQARRLSRLYALTYSTAATIAQLAYGVSP